MVPCYDLISIFSPPGENENRGDSPRGSRRNAATGLVVVHPTTGHRRCLSSGLSTMTHSVVRKQRGDRRRVLQRRAGHLGRVDDASLDEVFVLTRRGVQSFVGLARLRTLSRSRHPRDGVHRDLVEW